MDELYNLKDRFCHELKIIGGKNDISSGDLERAYYLASAVKNLIKILDACDEEYSEMDGSYGYVDTMRSRGRNANRYGRGRYSGDHRGYSRNGEDMVARLEHMIDEAPNDQIRHGLRQIVEQLHSM